MTKEELHVLAKIEEVNSILENMGKLEDKLHCFECGLSLLEPEYYAKVSNETLWKLLEKIFDLTVNSIPHTVNLLFRKKYKLEDFVNRVGAEFIRRCQNERIRTN